MDKPPLVLRAEELAERIGFPLMPAGRPAGYEGPASACIPQVGQLLMVLAAGKPGGRIGEHGTGSGVGTAWLASGMTGDSKLISAEINGDLVEAVRPLFAGRKNVELRHGDWREVMAGVPPFDLLFMDSGVGPLLAPENWDDVTGLVGKGGQIVMDDLVPTDLSPAESANQGNPKRSFAFQNSRVVSVEVRTTPATSALIITRIA